MNTYKKVLVVGLVCALYGCNATNTAISKRNLDVQTKMSETVFLDPVAPEKKTVFVQVKNTSGNQGFDVDSRIKNALTSKGYHVTSYPDKAHYMLQANVLQVGKTNLSETNSMLESGFGGGLIGAAAAGVAGGDGRTILGVGLAGALASMAADALVQDNMYTVITDLQISERTAKAKVNESTRAKLQQGSSTQTTLSSNEKSSWKRYQTRIISTANKANLKLEEALPELAQGLSSSIAGIM